MAYESSYWRAFSPFTFLSFRGIAEESAFQLPDYQLTQLPNFLECSILPHWLNAECWLLCTLNFILVQPSVFLRALPCRKDWHPRVHSMGCRRWPCSTETVFMALHGFIWEQKNAESRPTLEQRSAWPKEETILY